MSLELARARAALAREVASLEERLMSDADWVALTEFQARTGQVLPPRLDGSLPEGLPEGVRTSLNSNPLFLARASLLEALKALPDEEGPSQHVGGPDLAAQEAAPPIPSDPAQRIERALAALVARARAMPAPAREPDPPAPAAADAAIRGNYVQVVDETSGDLRLIAFTDDVVASRLNGAGILKFSDVAHLTVDQAALISVRPGPGNRASREKRIEEADGKPTAHARPLQPEDGIGPAEKLAAFPPHQNEPAMPPQPNAVQSLSDMSPRSRFSGTHLQAPPALRDELQFKAAPPHNERLNPATEFSAATSHLPPPLFARDEPVLPPPLPESPAKLAPQLPQLDDGSTAPAFASHGGCFPEHQPDVRIAPQSLGRAARGRRAGVQSSRAFARRWERDDDDALLSRSINWEQVEEAAVEIVHRAPPFPGVGPVQEAANRLRSAVEPPKPAILKALRRG